MPQSWAPGLPQLLAAPTDSQQPALPPPASVQLSLRPHHRSDGAAPHRTHAAVVPVQCTQSYATVTPERPVSDSRGGGSWNLASSVAIDRQRLAMGGSAAENATYRMASIEAGFERAAVQPAASVAAWVAVEGAGAHRRGQQLYGRLALSRRSARRERGREGGRTRREKAGVDRAVEVSLSRCARSGARSDRRLKQHMARSSSSSSPRRRRGREAAARPSSRAMPPPASRRSTPSRLRRRYRRLVQSEI
jgi:hypothetical protein